jgi:hypothetical protein
MVTLVGCVPAQPQASSQRSSSAQSIDGTHEVYVDSRHGFTIAYPKGWERYEFDEGVLVRIGAEEIRPEVFTVRVLPNQELEPSSSLGCEPMETIELSGVEGWKIYCTDLLNSSEKFVLIHVQKGSAVYEIVRDIILSDTYDPETYDEEWEYFLDHFRFEGVQ